MKPPIIEEIMNLKNQPLEAIRTRYVELFTNEEAPSNNKVFLWRKIAWRLQEIEYGGLSPNAQKTIASLIEKYDPINNKALRPSVTSGGKELVALPSLRDKRLPIPGTVIHKRYKGQDLRVKVLDKGFEYNNTIYKTLSAISKEITGAHWSGFEFFKL